jgi:hypothetical protein
MTVEQEYELLEAKIKAGDIAERLETDDTWKLLRGIQERNIESLKELLVMVPADDKEKILDIQSKIKVWRALFTAIEVVKVNAVNAETDIEEYEKTANEPEEYTEINETEIERY